MARSRRDASVEGPRSVTGPSTVTYRYGASSDCTHKVARFAARNNSALRDASPTENVIVLSPSSVYQTGAETGPRSGDSRLSTPTRGASVRNVSRSSGVMLRSIWVLRVGRTHRGYAGASCP